MSNREVMQQALVALEAAEELAGKHDAQLEYGFHQTITALRKALEQPEQEPVRMPCVGKDPRCPCQDGDACHYKGCGDTKALPERQAKPLTNEQADQIIGGLQTCHHQNSKRELLKVWLRDWAAHNIKEQL
jgi:hypothetical protein